MKYNTHLGPGLDHVERQAVDVPCPHCNKQVTLPLPSDNLNYKEAYEKLRKENQEFFKHMRDLNTELQNKIWDWEKFYSVSEFKKIFKKHGIDPDVPGEWNVSA